VVLIAAWLLAGGQAHAAGQFHHGASTQFDGVKGLVVLATTTSMRVQTATGAVPVGLASTTAVYRNVTGSTMDLARGQQIDARLTGSGATSLKSIHIEMPSTHAARHAPHAHMQPLWTDTTRLPARSSSGTLTVWGEITGIGSGTITVRSKHGVTTTYALTSNVRVTKTMSGRLADLGSGQSVSALVVHSTGVAAKVTILSC
jgi:hypothetical protein